MNIVLSDWLLAWLKLKFVTLPKDARIKHAPPELMTTDDVTIVVPELAQY